MRCIICDTDDWENVDRYRIRDAGMSMCKKCGFVTYPNKYKSEDEIKKYYNKDYRNPPVASNLHTQNKKMHYHAAFLEDLILKWKQNPQTNYAVFDVGAATGNFLHWIKQQVGCDIYGTEWTESYRRVAYHQFGIELGLDFDDSRKYDLISSYKVAEHQMDADVLLKKYVDALTEEGYIYISVPIWFEHFYSYGINSSDLDYYYHKDHINVWTRDLFETMLRKCGLEIIKENHCYYDSTYLCRKATEPLDTPTYEDPEKVKEIMARIKKAGECLIDNDFKGAIEHYGFTPQAWKGFYEKNRKQFHQQGYDYVKKEVLDKSIKHCPNVPEMPFFAGQIAARYEQYVDAIQYYETALEMSPNNPLMLITLSHAYRGLADIEKDENEKAKHYYDARGILKFVQTITLQGQDELLNWIYNDDTKIPIGYIRPDEGSITKE